MSDNPIFSYTRRDYESARKEGLSKIPLISKGVWTDLNATDPGVIILDYVHALADMINYYQDHQALEAFITTAKERKNLFRLANQLAFKINSAKGAICNVEFYSSLVYDYTIKIPKHTSVSTLSGIRYLTIEDAYIKAGDHRVSVPCVQGVINTRTYQGTGISRFSNVVGAKNQEIHLMMQNIDVDSIVITDNLGRLWSPVDVITFSMDTDRVYQVELNPDDTITIKFGDGERGVIPESTDTLTIEYMTTLAEEGRVSANSIVRLDDDIYNNAGSIIGLSVNNIQSSAGGSSTPTSREIRELAPGAIKAQGRAVTRDDFENLAKLVDGVLEAKAYDVNVKPDLLYYEVVVLIVPEDPDNSTDVLKESVHKFLSQRMLPPTNLQVKTPSYIYQDIEVSVRKLDNMSASRLEYEVEQAIIKYFNNRSGSVGESFYPSELISSIVKLEGVRSVLSISPNDTVGVDDMSVLRLGTLSVTIV